MTHLITPSDLEHLTIEELRVRLSNLMNELAYQKSLHACWQAVAFLQNMPQP